MKTPMRILALLICVHALAAAEPFHPLLLISMDGFRHDYWQRLPEQESIGKQNSLSLTQNLAKTSLSIDGSLANLSSD